MVGRHLTRVLAVLLAGTLCSCGQPGGMAKKLDTGGWVSLFDGKTLKGWKIADFYGAGKVYVKDGAIQMEPGDMCTGFTYAGDANDLPKENYEVEVVATRVKGEDFFCALTFPVGKSFVSLVCDGWGGAVTGLSCLDDFDASMNETTQDVEFKNNQWYRIRARVTKKHILCWVDDKQIIRVARKKRRISVRMEVEESCPLGVAGWQTHGAVRRFLLRRLDKIDLALDSEPEDENE